MSVGQALKFSRKARNLQQGEVGGTYGQSMIGKIERGERQVALDAAPHLATRLDHPALHMELARELTGGVGPAWLNGPNVDLHRAAVREKVLEELHEAQESIRAWSTSKPPSAETESDRKRRREHLLQVLDGIQWAYLYVSIQCEEYDFSMMHLWRDHYAKMRSKRYVEA